MVAGVPPASLSVTVMTPLPLSSHMAAAEKSRMSQASALVAVPSVSAAAAEATPMTRTDFAVRRDLRRDMRRDLRRDMRREMDTIALHGSRLEAHEGGGRGVA